MMTEVSYFWCAREIIDTHQHVLSGAWFFMLCFIILAVAAVSGLAIAKKDKMGYLITGLAAMSLSMELFFVIL